MQEIFILVRDSVEAKIIIAIDINSDEFVLQHLDVITLPCNICGSNNRLCHSLSGFVNTHLYLNTFWVVTGPGVKG